MIIDFIRGWEKKSTEKFHVPFPQFLSNLGSDVGAPHSVFGAPQLCRRCSVCVCGPAWLCPHARACPRPTAGLRAAPSLPASRHAHAPPGPSATAASLSISVVLFHEIILWSSLAGWRTLESFIFGTACCCLLSTRYKSWLTLCSPVDRSLARLLCPWDSPGKDRYWSGLLCPAPEDLPTQGSDLRLLQWQAGSLPLSHQGSP